MSAPAPVVVPPVDISLYPRLKPLKNRPPLPARALPMSVIEPRRDVPARTWVSPYCTAWNDAVESCERKDGNVDQPATCRAMTDPIEPADRKTIICTQADTYRFYEVCERMKRASWVSDGTKDLTLFSWTGDVGFQFDGKLHTWVPANGSGDTSEGRSPGKRDLAEFMRGSGWNYPEIRGTSVFWCSTPFTKAAGRTYVVPPP